MRDDFTDRLRELPPSLPDVSDRYDRVRRIVVRRRRWQVGLTMAGTVLVVVVPLAVVWAMPHRTTRPPSHHPHPHPPHGGLGSVASDCPAQGLSLAALPTGTRMTHSPTQARSALKPYGPDGRTVAIYPALVTDPVAGKLSLGDPSVPRPMWVAYRLATVPAAANQSDNGQSAEAELPGTRVAALNLIDDATLRPGGDFICKPVSATAHNVGYGLPAGAGVAASGAVNRAGHGDVLCFLGGTVLTDVEPSAGPLCTDQVALSGATHLLTHWLGKEAYVSGIWRAGGLSVTAIGPPRDDETDPFGHGPPCAAPAGGWAQVAPSPTPNLDFGAFEHYKSHHPGVVVTVASFHPTRLSPVLTIASTDPSQTRSALTNAYPRALCVVTSTFSLAEVHAARRAVKKAFASDALPSVYSFGSGVSAHAQATIDLSALSDRPALHSALAGLAPGLVVIQPWLHILSRS